MAAYNKALSLFPPEVSAAEKTLKKQCKEGVAIAQETHNRLLKQARESQTSNAPASGINLDSEMLPWNRALRLRELPDPKSSVCHYF